MSSKKLKKDLARSIKVIKIIDSWTPMESRTGGKLGVIHAHVVEPLFSRSLAEINRLEAEIKRLKAERKAERKAEIDIKELAHILAAELKAIDLNAVSEATEKAQAQDESEWFSVARRVPSISDIVDVESIGRDVMLGVRYTEPVRGVGFYVWDAGVAGVPLVLVHGTDRWRLSRVDDGG